MFKKIIVKGLIIFSISIILLTAFFGWFINADFRTVGERILDSVVTVEGSSGVVVYSEENMALVLTAYHTIEDEIKKTACTGCEYSFSVSVENKYYMGPKLITSYYPTYVYIDEVNDLAMIKIITNEKLNYSKISKYKAYVGDEIYIGSNPNHLFRSLKRGIVSSTDRFMGNSKLIEVDAGIIFGSSGGGVFNTDGELVAVVRSMRMYSLWNQKNCYVDPLAREIKCIIHPVPFIGFATPQDTIKRFLFNSPFSENFRYL